MADKICLLCNHWPVCMKHISKSRKYKLWNAPEQSEQFLRLVAENCDYWQKDVYVEDEIESHRLLKRIIEALEEGKIVAIYKNGTGPVHIQGIFNSEKEILTPPGENHTIFLKAVANQVQFISKE